MKLVCYTEALEMLLEGATVRRHLPDGHYAAEYIAPLRAAWQPPSRITPLWGRCWVGEVHRSHNPQKAEGLRDHTFTPGERGSVWEILTERGVLPGNPEDWIINPGESREMWRKRNAEAILKAKDAPGLPPGLQARLTAAVKAGIAYCDPNFWAKHLVRAGATPEQATPSPPTTPQD